MLNAESKKYLWDQIGGKRRAMQDAFKGIDRAKTPAEGQTAAIDLHDMLMEHVTEPLTKHEFLLSCGGPSVRVEALVDEEDGVVAVEVIASSADGEIRHQPKKGSVWWRYVNYMLWS